MNREDYVYLEDGICYETGKSWSMTIEMAQKLVGVRYATSPAARLVGVTMKSGKVAFLKMYDEDSQSPDTEWICPCLTISKTDLASRGIIL